MKISVTASTRATALVVVESCIFVLLNIATLVGNSQICFAFYRNLSSYDYKLLCAVIGPHRFIHGDFSYTFECQVSHSNEHEWTRIGLLCHLLFRMDLSRSFNIDGDAVGNKQIFSRSSTYDLPKTFHQKTICNYVYLCLGCTNNSGHRCRFGNDKATSKSYSYWVSIFV